MLRSASRILGYRLAADDGEVGRCVDFLVEQSSWIVRYVVVDTGARLDGSHVLVSPLRLRKSDWASRRWALDGTRDQVETEPASARSLQSLKQLIGFGLDDAEGNVGHIEDLLVDDDNWHCRHLLIKGEIHLSGRKTLVPTEWLGQLHVDEHRIEAPLPRARIEGAPEYRPDAPGYQLRVSAANDALRPAAGGSMPASWRFSPPVAWATAVEWGTRGLKAALARTIQGR